MIRIFYEMAKRDNGYMILNVIEYSEIMGVYDNYDTAKNKMDTMNFIPKNGSVYNPEIIKTKNNYCLLAVFRTYSDVIFLKDKNDAKRMMDNLNSRLVKNVCTF